METILPSCRIDKILKDKNLKPAQFAKKIAIHPTRVYDLLSGKIGSITQKLADGIVESFPEYSRTWLITGEGSPYDEYKNMGTCPVCADRIDEAEVIEEIPYTPKSIVEARNLDIEKLVRTGSQTLEKRSIVDLLDNFDYAQPVISGAMSPYFKRGDTLFLRFLPEGAELVDGEVYSVDTPQYGCLLRRVKVEGDTLRLIATCKGYEDILVKRSDVMSVALVIHLLRTGFTPSYDLEEPSSKKNIQQVLDAQDQLIAEIRAQNEEVREQNRRNHELVEHIINHLK